MRKAGFCCALLWTLGWIALMIRLSRRMKATGGRMWIENPARQPKRVIDAAGIDRLIPVAAGTL